MSTADSSPYLSRARLLRAPVLTGALAAAALAILHVRDPHLQGSYGFCPFLEITGKPCAGCGGLRAVNLLTHGQVGAAVSSNLLVVLAVAIFAIAWVVWLVRRGLGEQATLLRVSSRSAAMVALLVFVFWIVRLTPTGAWLAP